MTTKNKFAELKKLFVDISDEELKPARQGKPSERCSDQDKNFHKVHSTLALIRFGMTNRPVIDDRIGQKSKKSRVLG